MSGIHPVSAALLVGVGVVILIGLIVSAAAAVLRWQRRRVALRTQPEVDLSYFYEATEAFREASRRWAEEATAAEVADIELVEQPPWIPPRRVARSAVQGKCRTP